MKKLNYYVKVAPIIFNLEELGNYYVAKATNTETKEETPIFSVKKEYNGLVTVEYFDNRKFKLKMIEETNNLLVIPYQITGTGIQLEEPILISTKARLWNLECLTPFEFTYCEGRSELEEELDLPFRLSESYFSATVEPSPRIGYWYDINPYEIKLVGFYNNKFLVITDRDVFINNVFEKLNWLVGEVKKLGAENRKRETNQPYKITFKYLVKTIDGDYVSIKQEFDYLTEKIDLLETELRVLNKDSLELTYYTYITEYNKDSNLEKIISREEIEVLKDVENFRTHLGLNLDSKNYFGADLIYKREFVNKFSLEIYNTILEALVFKPGRRFSLQQSGNKLLLYRLVRNLEKFDTVTFKFIVDSNGTGEIGLNYNPILSEEQNKAVVVFNVNTSKENLVQRDTVVVFHKEDFRFLEALPTVFETASFESFTVPVFQRIFNRLFVSF